ncbi:ABC transporter ATP-binding protein/permease [Ruminococcaceae bacterium OttesenSCG-928-I18]|nr:ABC transporter ATP-binding protein/permease [Ruminococcaceae bacterium OttesenSCG-928-I18]
MKQIAKCFKGNYREMTLGPLFKLAEAVLELLVPLVTASIIDVGVANGDTAFVLQRGGLLLLLAVLGAAAGLTCQYFAAGAAANFGQHLRRQVFAQVMRLSPAETGHIGTGGLSTRITNDVNQIQAALNMLIRLGTRVPFLAVGGILMAMILNVRAGLIYLAATALITLVLVLVMRHTMPKYGEIQAGQDELFRLGMENLEGVRVIRAFSRQGSEKKTFDASADRLTKLLLRTGKISAALNPAASVAANGAVILVVWLGAGYVHAGTMQTGEVIALVNYMTQVLLALLVAANLIVLFTRAIASVKRVESVLEIQPAVTDGPSAAGRTDAPAFAFKGVEFCYYEGADNALSGLSFEAQPGQTIGVIGGTGSGKSTLVRLLLRHYDVDKGSVEVQGVDVRRYTLPQLHEKIGVVPQKTILFSGTIRTNLQMAAPNADEKALWDALRAAQATDFVRQKKEGLDTPLGEGGAGLSGGQRQRLAIARALVRRPEILILDDAASALDYATEAALRRALKALAAESGNRMTTLLISQRVAAIRQADVILVLDEGRLVGKGVHESLLRENELYREICASQGIDH